MLRWWQSLTIFCKICLQFSYEKWKTIENIFVLMVTYYKFLVDVISWLWGSGKGGKFGARVVRFSMAFCQICRIKRIMEIFFPSKNLSIILHLLWQNLNDILLTLGIQNSHYRQHWTWYIGYQLPSSKYCLGVCMVSCMEPHGFAIRFD
jgi:hypothetical protein